jgi:hypothetical protein
MAKKENTSWKPATNQQTKKNKSSKPTTNQQTKKEESVKYESWMGKPKTPTQPKEPKKNKQQELQFLRKEKKLRDEIETLVNQKQTDIEDIDLGQRVQEENAFYFDNENTEFVDVEKVDNRIRAYTFTQDDFRIIIHYMVPIVDPLKKKLPTLFVKYKLSASGCYLNIFNKNPVEVDTNVAHISLHSFKGRYHFKIMRPRLFGLVENNKNYIIPFKMHRHEDTGELSATIQPFVTNENTEIMCPPNIIVIFRSILDRLVTVLNRPRRRGGVQTRRKRHIINKKQTNKNRRRKR